MTTANPKLDQLCVNTIRALAIDAVLKANSGHPGLPLGAAPVAYALFARAMKHNPANPALARPRPLRALGRARLDAALQPAAPDRLRPARSTSSSSSGSGGASTPGHPEYGDTPGVETTTGPLGQGFAMSVGMAIAEAHLAARFNRPGHAVVDHHTYVLAGDGDLMEGVAHEAASLAGHLELGKLVVFYDSNRISLAGSTNLSFTDDVARVFDGYGWHVQTVADGNDLDAIARAIEAGEGGHGQAVAHRSCRPQIGFGSPKQGTFGVHGSPLNAEQVVETKRKLGYPSEEPFFVPEEALAHLRRGRRARARPPRPSGAGASRRTAKAHPDLAAELRARDGGRAAEGLGRGHPDLRGGRQADRHALGRREGHQRDRRARAGAPRRLGRPQPLDRDGAQGRRRLPEPGHGRAERTRARSAASGATADATSTSACASTRWARSPPASPSTAASIPFSATFFTFADYMRPAIRLAALMKLRVDLRLHPRQHRRRRGRPDAPADRARRGAARDPAPHA